MKLSSTIKPIATQPKPTVVPQPPKPIVTPVSKSEPASTSEDLKDHLERIELEDIVHHKKFIFVYNQNKKAWSPFHKRPHAIVNLPW